VPEVLLDRESGSEKLRKLQASSSGVGRSEKLQRLALLAHEQGAINQKSSL
jgi:hypothetical protein